MTDRPALRALGDRLGIVPAYHDIGGRLHTTGDGTYEALASAMGHDASTEAAAARALERLDREAADRLLPPVLVLPLREAHGAVVPLRLPSGAHGPLLWAAELTDEEGIAHTAEGQLEVGERAAPRIPIPGAPRPGYHRLAVEVRSAAGSRRDAAPLILVPAACHAVADALGPRRAFGVWANLYTLRTGRDWGVGDLGSLRELARWAGERGAAFLGTNPLHALRNTGLDVSPYSPVSRLYRNPLYLDVESIPELAESAEARALIAAESFQAALDAVRTGDRVDYERVMSLKWPVIEALYRTFAARARDGQGRRGLAYQRYLAAEGDALLHHATFLALEEHLRGQGVSGPWPRWPAPLRDPRGSAVTEFRRARADRVDLHRYVQFELDRQMGLAAAEASAAGMALGLYQDLAVGSAASGSDAWAYGDLLARGASVGAPPDALGPEGQDWGLPPLDPHRLRRTGYGYWRRLLTNAMDHAGMLRIDHVMGVRRLFWIPEGRPASEGAYVTYPERDLLGILALESARHRTVVVGEDLGTVPEGFAETLEAWGVLSSRVLYFERSDGGEFRPAAAFSPRALVTVATHDLVPLAGFWTGRDLKVRRELGLLDEREAEAAAERRAADRHQLLARLRAEGILGEGPVSYAELCQAVHAFLARTPAPLVGLALDDLAGETSPVNVPGVTPDRYPAWARRLGLTLEELRADETVAAGLAGAAGRALGDHRGPGS